MPHAEARFRSLGLCLALAILPVARAQYSQQGSKLVGTGAAGASGQGRSVALSIDGNTAVVGGTGDNNNQGAVWVFVRAGTAWTQQGPKLVGSGPVGSNVRQGFSVAVSADGNTIVEGGPGDNGGTGAVWIFTRAGGIWSQQGGKLAGFDTVGAASQGFSVGMSSNGNTAIVGGPADNFFTGAAWVYTRSGGAWTQQGGKLVGAGGSGSQGTSVTLSSNGNTAVSSAADNSGGHAWIFILSNGIWSQPGSSQGGVGSTDASGRVGGAAAISGDGNTIVTGAPDQQSALVFSHANGVWSPSISRLGGDGASGSPDQGFSVAVSSNGNTAISTGPSDGGDVGAFWVFTRSNNLWSQRGNKVIGVGSVGPARLGTSVASSSDATTVIVGGPNDNGGVGAVWVFTALGANQIPAVTSITPAAGTGSGLTLTLTFNAPRGFASLDVLNVLINDALDGRHACYLAYSVPSNALYIVANSGDSSQISGKGFDGTGFVANDQCSVALAASTATGVGNTFTLLLNLTFSQTFTGNKVIYAAARDTAQNNSGWQTMGVRTVPPLPQSFPTPSSMNPPFNFNAVQNITFSYQDQTSGSNLQTVWALINTAIDGRAACYIAYYRPGNQLFLYPDNGDGNQAASIVLAGNNTISNSQCSITAVGSQVQIGGGNTLTISLAFTFKPAFAGFKAVWMAAQTLAGAVSPWQALGAMAIPAQ